MKRRRGGAALAAGVLVACSTWVLAACAEAPPTLAGEWVSSESAGPETVLLIEDGGAMRWIVNAGEEPDTFVVNYEVDFGAEPVALDVGPWRRGLLQGLVLMGIVERHGPHRIRVDFEPVPPGSSSAHRPVGFTEQAMNLVRRRDGSP